MGALSWVVRQSAELENSMTSVERMCAYAKAPSEAEELKPPPCNVDKSKGGAAGGGSPRDGSGSDGSREAVVVAARKGAKGVDSVDGGSDGGGAGEMASGRQSSSHRWPWSKAAAAKDEDDDHSDCLPPMWPTSGAVRFEDVVARYQPGLRPVLAGVSFDLKPGQMMGVVSCCSGLWARREARAYFLDRSFYLCLRHLTQPTNASRHPPEQPTNHPTDRSAAPAAANRRSSSPSSVCCASTPAASCWTAST
jgi:hypothetical protein